jgi:hypothetical protein
MGHLTEVLRNVGWQNEKQIGCFGQVTGEHTLSGTRYWSFSQEIVIYAMSNRYLIMLSPNLSICQAPNWLPSPNLSSRFGRLWEKS